MQFEITDVELGGATKTVCAPGIAEAMYEYLPWPVLQINITWRPTQGIADVVDLQTDFKYEVRAK